MIRRVRAKRHKLTGDNPLAVVLGHSQSRDKTVGDAPNAASILPVPRPSRVRRLCLAGLP